MIRDYRVIDFHVHTGTDSNYNPWVIDFFKDANETYRDNFVHTMAAADVRRHMEDQGVEKAVTLAEYNPVSSGTVTNEYLSDFCRGQEDFFIPMGSLNFNSFVPLYEQARHAVEKLGMKGFKLLPSYAHFYPDDPRLFSVYKYAQDAGLPIMFHTGTSVFRGTLVKYADPLLLDTVAETFPELKILLEHGGRSFWYDRAAWMLMRHKNVYIGCAGIPAKHLKLHFPKLEEYSDRFIFGSDWPGISGIRTMAEKIMDLPYAREVKEKILFYNALSVLNMKE